MSKIIAIDFDGTLCTDKWPGIGDPILSVIKRFFFEQLVGTKFILWTCREGAALEEAVQWCASLGIIFDAVNEHLPEQIARYGTDPRKIGADSYWEDRAVRMPE